MRNRESLADFRSQYSRYLHNNCSALWGALWRYYTELYLDYETTHLQWRSYVQYRPMHASFPDNTRYGFGTSRNTSPHKGWRNDQWVLAAIEVDYRAAGKKYETLWMDSRPLISVVHRDERLYRKKIYRRTNSKSRVYTWIIYCRL